MSEIETITEMRKAISCKVHEQVDNGLENVSTIELGAAVDMIKDLAEAEKEMREAHYYKTVFEAMNRDTTEQHYDMEEPMTEMKMEYDVTKMTPAEQLTHLQHDVETMWNNASAEHRKRIKENLSKWASTLTV